jgi:hypothetical protein
MDFIITENLQVLLLQSKALKNLLQSSCKETITKPKNFTESKERYSQIK